MGMTPPARAARARREAAASPGMGAARAGGLLGAWAVIAALLALAGCTSAPATSPVTEPSPAQRLAAAKSVVDAATSVHLVLTSRDLPDGVSGVTGADGVGAHPPAFKGTIQARLGGTLASVDVVAIDQQVHVKLPLTTVYATVDPATLGAPDPATLFDPGRGITSLLTATVSPVTADAARRGAEVLTSYTGTLPGTAIADLLTIGDRAGTFAVRYGVAETSGQLRTVELTGPFYPGRQSTYVLTLDRYGEPVEIRAP